jgi:outer membrane immunogenic protein
MSEVLLGIIAFITLAVSSPAIALLLVRRNGLIMRNILASLAVLTAAPLASAADIPQKASPTSYDAPYNWTGLYIGAQDGYGWATQQNTRLLNPPGPISFPVGTVFNPVNLTGVVGGFYGGYNYQINHFLVGIDGDFSFATLTGTGTDTATDGDIAHPSHSMKWISTATGRLGYANNNWMWFAKGGAAWAEFDFTGVITTSGGAIVSAILPPSSNTFDGWTVGGGVEWGFASHWSAKVEYDYAKFYTANFDVTSISSSATNYTNSAASTLNMLKGGVAYRF